MTDATTLVPAVADIFSNNLHLGCELQRLMLKYKRSLVEAGESLDRVVVLLGVHLRRAIDSMFMRLVFSEPDNPAWTFMWDKLTRASTQIAEQITALD